MVDTFVPTKAMSNQLILLLKISLGVSVMGILAQALDTNMLYRALEGAEISEAELEANALRQQLINGIQAFTFIGVFLFFLRWFHTSYKNLVVLGATPSKHSPGLVVAHYFIPLVQLYWPFRTMRELWNGSNPDYVHNDVEASQKAAPAIFIWWAIFLFMCILHLTVILNSLGQHDTAHQYTMSLISFGSHFLHLIFILATIRLVRTVSWMQQQKHWLLQYPW